MVRVNLIPPQNIEARHVRRALRRWSIANGACVLFVLIGMVVVHAFGGVEEATLRTELERTATLTNDARARMGQLGGQLAETDARLSANLVVRSQPDWSILLAIMSDTIGTDIMLTALRLGSNDGLDAAGTGGRRPAVLRGPIDPSSLGLVIGGLSRDQAAAMQFILRLEQIGLFEQVTLADTRIVPYRDGEAVAFTIACKIDAGHQSRSQTP